MNFIENESHQKLRGGYYTPPRIASFLSRWVLESGAREILEPSCGDGVFIDAMHATTQPSPTRIVACELDSEEAAKASSRARRYKKTSTEIVCTDYLSWSLGQLAEKRTFDAVVGNPPFIRYQYLDSAQQKRAENVFSRFSLPFTKHTNAWVPFVVSSIAMLRAGGRIAMVVPAEILHVLHATSLRSFILSECSRVLVVDPEELMFGEALQGVVLLLAERSSLARPGSGRLAVRTMSSTAFLEESPSHLFETSDFVSGDHLSSKWMKALLSPAERELLSEIEHNPRVHRFDDIASVDVGIVTGANKFFLVSDATVKQYDLDAWAHPMFGRSNHVQGVIYDDRNHLENSKLGLPTNFLWFPIHDTELNAGARRYIREGEADGLDSRYKCRIRTPWYRVPSVRTAPVGMLKRCHHYPRLVLNQAEALTTDTAYRIVPKDITGSKLVGCFVNSLTALTAELEGRHYGGGVLELVPSEIERLLIPLPSSVHKSLVRNLDEQVRSESASETLIAAQDSRVLVPIGVRQSHSDMLISAWSRLRHRRHRTPTASAEDQEDVDSSVATTRSRRSKKSLVPRHQVHTGRASSQ